MIETLDLAANVRGTPRNAFTALLTEPLRGPGMILFALAVAASLGAFHALEPGHGKTVVAAYLVGARGTVWHAVLLGLVVTASHTAGVYLLGGVTLYASRYVVPERLYPWLGAASGLLIVALGANLLYRRLTGGRRSAHGHTHGLGHADHHGPPATTILMTATTTGTTRDTGIITTIPRRGRSPSGRSSPLASPAASSPARPRSWCSWAPWPAGRSGSGSF